VGWGCLCAVCLVMWGGGWGGGGGKVGGGEGGKGRVGEWEV